MSAARAISEIVTEPAPLVEYAAAPIAVGIMAYNEEANICGLLDSILAQDIADRITRIIVIASGCTDRTCDLVESYMERDPRIELVAEGRRAGKIAAINTFLAGVSEPIVVVSCGDLRFEPGTLRALAEPLARPGVGMTGAHPVPLNDDTTFAGFAVNVMWDLHHRVASVVPKMGELVAFRNVFASLDVRALCDELSIQKKISEAGLSVVYAADARVRNRGPETVREFVRQRIRWNAANLQVIRDHGMEVSTMNPDRIAPVLLDLVRERRPRLDWLAGLAVLESYCRVRAFVDYFVLQTHEKHRMWVPLASTKSLGVAPESA